jgi:RNA-directed DNA polymerase
VLQRKRLQEKLKREDLKSESTDAEHWGRTAYMSIEIAVMVMEQRGCVKRLMQYSTDFFFQEEILSKTKPFNIPKRLVVEAWEAVKANAGAAGVDLQSIDDFERNLKDNLYKLWNRLSSGSYFPPPVKAIAIPKKSGGERILGVPTVTDRIAQRVVMLAFEPEVEPYFLEDSYGYRPNKSALDAVGITRKRCWKYDWVLEFDIVRLFDNLPRPLLMKAVTKHSQCKWVLLYIERWLKAPTEMPDGSLIVRSCGTTQGGVISPLLSNLFMHYAFDRWIQSNYPKILWCRYADDGLLHCKSEYEAKYMLKILTQRFAECGLQLHPDKTRIIYCKDDNRTKDHPRTSFEFLGYTYRARQAKKKNSQELFIGFTPAVSNQAKKSMRDKIRQHKWHLRSDLELKDIAQKMNPMLNGWFNYYGRYYPSALNGIGAYFNAVLVKWAKRKYKKLRRSNENAVKYIKKTAIMRSKLFVHWNLGIKQVLA